MRSSQSLVAFQIAMAMSLYGCGCFVPVIEKQCDNRTACGSGWICVGGVCYPPVRTDGGTGGGTGTGGGLGVGGGTIDGNGGGGVGGAGGGGSFCSGCRDANGKCQTGNVNASCGSGGKTCAVCTSLQTCSAGTCTPFCNATTCAKGCCSAGVCVPYSIQSEQRCGSNAAACFQCGTNLTCTSGECKPVVTSCTPNNCFNGCCDQGKCVPFQQQSTATCGVGGAQCKPCMNGSSCDFGSCTPKPPACSPANCSGCCTVNGVCAPGDSMFSCGKNGAACIGCPGGQSCQAQTCTPLSMKKVGDPCVLNIDCAAIGPGAYCKSYTSSGNLYPGGFCTRACSPMSSCPTGNACLTSLGMYGENDPICAPRCMSSGQCRSPGYACLAVDSTTSACWLTQGPAPDGGVVGVDAGVSTQIGSACVGSAQCTSPSGAFCIPDSITGVGPSGFVGGYCSTLCNATGSCSAGSSCESVATAIGITQQLCLRNCNAPFTGQANCRNGYVCDGTGFTLTIGVCVPRCNNSGAVCPAGTTCSAATGYCN